MQFNKQYDFQEISNIPIYFVKTHNLALPIWGEFSKNIRNEKLELEIHNFTGVYRTS